MRIFRHPFSWVALGIAALIVGIVIDVRSVHEPAGLVLSVILLVSLVMGILTGTGIIFKK